MGYFIVAFFGLGCGAALAYVLLEKHRKALKLLSASIEFEKGVLSRSALEYDEKRHLANEQLRQVELNTTRKRQECEAEIKNRIATVEFEIANRKREIEDWLSKRVQSVEFELHDKRNVLEEYVTKGRTAFDDEVSSKRISLTAQIEEHRRKMQIEVNDFTLAKDNFDRQVIKYSELVNENVILKRDLSMLYQQNRKFSIDRGRIKEKQQQIETKVQELGESYLRDQEKWIGEKLNPNNYPTCKERLAKAIEKCREIGIVIPELEEKRLYAELKRDYELELKAAIEREEQARIKAQIREEAKLEREAQQAIEQAARERAIVEKALAEALTEAHGQHNAEIEALQAKLAEAEANSQRAISQAQLTKSGNVYIISNVGSFGDGVFKIGMTRRLEPLDRIKELGDASVPFPFDIHMMIACDDAPSLEYTLHRAFHTRRINRVNLRKEFFRVSLEEIVAIVKENHGDVTYRADAEALQYNNSLKVTDEDLEFVEEVYEEEEEDNVEPIVDVE